MITHPVIRKVDAAILNPVAIPTKCRFNFGRNFRRVVTYPVKVMMTSHRFFRLVMSVASISWGSLTTEMKELHHLHYW